MEVETSHLNKIFFPNENITKGDILEYYEAVTEYMLPFLRNRIVVLHRFPDGVNGENFYQKEVTDYFPKFIKRVKVKTKGAGTQEFPVIENKESLIYLANLGTITFHIWLSQIDKLNYPDKLIFDIDPPDGKMFEDVKFTAFKLKGLLDSRNLKSFPMLTGSKGLHVVVPLDQSTNFEIVHEFAKSIATKLADEYPDKLTIEQRINKRKERVFIDYLRNSFGQNAVAPFSVRARPGASVAVPIEWEELESSNIKSNSYTIKNVFERLSEKHNPWKDFFKTTYSISRS